MRLSAQQAQILFQIAIDSSKIKGNLGGFSQEQRLELINSILNQQDRIVRELDDGETESSD